MQTHTLPTKPGRRVAACLLALVLAAGMALPPSFAAGDASSVPAVESAVSTGDSAAAESEAASASTSAAPDSAADSSASTDPENTPPPRKTRT